MQHKNLKLILVLLALVALAGCSSGKKVTRIAVDEQIDLSGHWNDIDSQQVSKALIDQTLATPWVEDFLAENGRKPAVIIGRIANKTPEHIAVKTFMADLERQFINGGRATIVASVAERDQLRDERADQQQYSSPATMKKWGREKGADFMLLGEINMVTDTEAGDQVKYYQVDCYLVDLQDNTKVWAGFKKIKKFIGRSKYKS